MSSESSTLNGTGMVLEGIVHNLGDEMNFDSGFRKRELRLELDSGDSKYQQIVCLEAHSAKVDMLNTVKAGDKIKVAFDIRGKEYNGRYFTNLVLWKIQMLEEGAGSSQDREDPW